MDRYFALSPDEGRDIAAFRKRFGRNIWQHFVSEMKLGPDGGLARVHWPETRAVSEVYLDLFDAAGVNTAPLRAMPIDDAFYHAMDEVLVSGNRTLEADPRTAKLVPPNGVHWQRRDQGVLIDFRNCDILSENLVQAGTPLKPGGRYLDFGCSSARTVRTFWGAYPDMHWAGVDPLPTSINWAAKVLPEIDLHVNNRWPPMDVFPDGSFDGMYALSIWSHFSELSGIEWLNEMHRLLKPGGFALITCNGYSEILRRLWIDAGKLNHLDPDVLVRAYNGLVASGFYFEPDLMKYPEFKDQSHWSHTFISRKWFRALEETGKWKLAHYADMQWGHKQDIVVLVRQ